MRTVFALLPMCAAAVAPADERPDARVALVVGVGSYDKNQFKNPECAVGDATALADALQAAGWKVTRLISDAKDPRAAATGANIREQLKVLTADRTAKSAVLVAFAGHVLRLADTDETYLVPTDAHAFRRTSFVRWTEVCDALRPCPAGVRLALLDAPREDPLAAAVKRTGLVRLARAPKAVRPPPAGVVLLSAADAGERSLEFGGGGVFWRTLAKGLAGPADKNRDGRVLLAEWVAHTREQTAEAVRGEFGEGTKQTVRVVGSDASPLVLADPAPAPIALEPTVGPLPADIAELLRFDRKGSRDKLKAQAEKLRPAAKALAPSDPLAARRVYGALISTGYFRRPDLTPLLELETRLAEQSRAPIAGDDAKARTAKLRRSAQGKFDAAQPLEARAALVELFAEEEFTLADIKLLIQVQEKAEKIAGGGTIFDF